MAWQTVQQQEFPYKEHGKKTKLPRFCFEPSQKGKKKYNIHPYKISLNIIVSIPSKHKRKENTMSMGSSVYLLLLLVLFSGMALLSDARNFKGQWLKASELHSDAVYLEGQWSKTSMLLKKSHPKEQWDSFSSLPLISDTRYLEVQRSKTSRVTPASYPNGHRDSFSDLSPLPSDSNYMEGTWSKTTMFPKKLNIKGLEDSFSSLAPPPDAKYLNLKKLQDFLPNVPLLSDTRYLEGKWVKTSWFVVQSLMKGDNNSSKSSPCTHDPNKKDPGNNKCPTPPWGRFLKWRAMIYLLLGVYVVANVQLTNIFFPDIFKFVQKWSNLSQRSFVSYQCFVLWNDIVLLTVHKTIQ